MKIKTKLIISFCIIIFVPSILAIATISAYCNFQSHVIEQTYGIKNADAYSIINSVPMLNRYTAPDFEKIKKTIKLSPSKMEDVSYLSEINESLEQKYSYLVVRIGENISFNGGSDNEKILSELQALVAFAGIDPMPNQSGDKNVRSNKSSKRGSPYLRKTLFNVIRTFPLISFVISSITVLLSTEKQVIGLLCL